MALSYKKGHFAAITTTGNQAVTGIGFQPKALRVWVTSRTISGTYGINVYFSRGFAASATQRGCCSGASDDGQVTTDGCRGIFTDRLIHLYSDGNTTANGTADLVSFDADGFTINWSDALSAAYIVHWEAYGGADITNVKVGTVTLATTGATTAFTDPGFQPDYVEILDARVTVAGNANGLYTSYGAASAAAAQAALAIGDQDAAADSQTGLYQRSGSLILAVNSLATPTELYRCSLASFDANGFTINNDVQPTAANVCLYLAIKGGRWKVGVETQKTATGTKVTSALGVGTVRGVSFWGGGSTTSASVQDVGWKISVGGADGTNEGYIWQNAQDAQATSDTNSLTVTTKAFGHGTSPSTTDAEADCTSLADSSFTLDWTTADATAREFIYVVAGDSLASGPAVPHIAATTSLYAITLAGSGAVSLTVPFIASTTTVYAPSVGLRFLVPHIGALTTVYAPTLTGGAAPITAPFIASATSLYAPVLVQAGTTLFVPYIASTGTVRAPSIARAGIGEQPLGVSIALDDTVLQNAPTWTRMDA